MLVALHFSVAQLIKASWNWTLVFDLSEESGKSGWEEVGGKRSGCEVGWVGFSFGVRNGSSL